MAKFCLNVDKHRAQILANVHAFLDKLPVDRPWQIVVEPLQKERTSKQNRALFGVAYAELEEQTGSEKNDLHWAFCGEFFGWNEVNVMGKTKKMPARTTTTGYDGKHDVVSTEIFARFYDFIQRRAAENGFYVSDPDPMWRIPEHLMESA